MERESGTLGREASATALVDPAPEPTAREHELIRTCATSLLELVPDLAVAMARHLHDQVPELNAEGADAVEATRRSCAANMREMCIMLRAGLPATAHETPADALEYAHFMRSHGVGLVPLQRAYELGVSMFGPVAATEFERNTSDRELLESSLASVQLFVWSYIDRVTERLAEEYGTQRSRAPGPEDLAWTEPNSAQAAHNFMAERSRQNPTATTNQGGARRDAERSLERFKNMIDAAGRDESLSRRLALAGTTVRVQLADEPDLALTLLLDRTPAATAPGNQHAEVEMSIASVDLERLTSDEFNLAMAIARGRVRVSGPIRKFLRISPIVRQLPVPQNGNGTAPHQTETTEPQEEDTSKFDPATQQLLDKAAEYQYHQGALDYREENPGAFWSIECRHVYKTFGRNRVLNGLDVGIPEGMITVVLGPSGTGKSVLISHLIGLMFPDQGEVIVHGRNVADLRMSELLEMRRKFGILFQDGALFGSMNVYDNVAFPLRQHTDKSESEIAEIVNQRLAEVGLSEAGDRAPGELSGGMRKRAGFARALVLDPEIVMFDEPDSGLDPVRTALLCELIQQMHSEHGGTYIVVTHDIASARKIAEYLVVLWKGRIVQAGDRDDMFTSSNPFVRQFLAGQARGPLGME